MTRSAPTDDRGVDVELDADQLAERAKRPEVARALARLLLRSVRDRLTQQPAPASARKP